MSEEIVSQTLAERCPSCSATISNRTIHGVKYPGEKWQPTHWNCPMCNYQVNLLHFKQRADK